MVDATELRCFHCDELIAPDDDAQMPVIRLQEGATVGHYHHECVVRLVIGGANHLQSRCTCCGGTEPPDPPQLTKRQAARMALNIWVSRVESGNPRGTFHS